LHIIHKFLIFIVLIFGFNGCFDAPIYSRIEQSKLEKIDFQKIKNIEIIQNDLLKEADKQNILDSLNFSEKLGSSLKVELSYYISKSCNNPERKSFASDYDGFVRLIFYFENQRFYQLQTQFRGDRYDEPLLRILDFAKEELGIF